MEKQGDQLIYDDELESKRKEHPKEYDDID